MSALIQTIVSALHLLAFTGECAESEYYPLDVDIHTTGYVTIDGCELPTVPAMTAGRQCQIFAHLTGEDDIACRADDAAIDLK